MKGGLVAGAWMLAAGIGGCIVFEEEDCRDGSSRFFLTAGHGPGYSDPIYHEYTRGETLERDGTLFAYNVRAEEGSGRVDLSRGRLTNVSQRDFRDRLTDLGIFSKTTDLNVSFGWKGHVDAETWDRFCRVVHEEWSPRQNGEGRVGCADGGALVFQFSTERGDKYRDAGCQTDISMDKYESDLRLAEAYSELREQTRRSTNAPEPDVM